MPVLRLNVRPYRRRFRSPLRTHHGVWQWREGLILRLEDHRGRRGYGEIAPLPAFGTETLAEAIACCRQWGDLSIPLETFKLATVLNPSFGARYPATQFALGSALEQLAIAMPRPLPVLEPAAICALLPTGADALGAWPQLWAAGHRTFKWKIGVDQPERERAILRRLRSQLPPSAQLRLDANGGLREAEAEVWLALCDRLGIEFLEQPFPPSHWTQLLALATRYRTPLALDESVASLSQLEDGYRRGWRGVFVVKGAIVGAPQGLRQLAQRQLARHQPLDLVLSSVFETAIARHAVLHLAEDLGIQRALGFGVQQWLIPDGLEDPDPERIWQSLADGAPVEESYVVDP